MQKKTDGAVPVESGDWRLSFRSVRVHNNHLQIGQENAASCRICTEGLGGALEKIEVVRKPDKKDEVAKSGGADEKGDSSSPYDDWARATRNADEVLARRIGDKEV